MYSIEDDFTQEQIDRARARRRDVRPLRFTSMAVGLIVPCLLGLTPWGAAIIKAAGSLAGGGWIATAFLGPFAISLILDLVDLPFDVWGERVNRRWGLSTRSWRLFAADEAKGFVIGATLFVLVWAGLYALMHAAPGSWWIWAALAAAALTVAGSFLVPVLIEPLFNRFTPMPDGPLRERILALVDQSGLNVRDILVSDGSKRTTAANAYVSGFGRTRRVVVWDTTIDQLHTDEVAAIAAHELGHAAKRDVLVFTVVGAVAAAASVVVIAALLSWQPLLDAAGVAKASDPRSLALILALFGVIGALSGPLGLAVSRRVEARADGYALDLVRDPATISAMEAKLAVLGLSNLEQGPVEIALFASHPPIPARIAHAREWAASHGVEVPGPLAASR